MIVGVVLGVIGAGMLVYFGVWGIGTLISGPPDQMAVTAITFAALLALSLLFLVPGIVLFRIGRTMRRQHHAEADQGPD